MKRSYLLLAAVLSTALFVMLFMVLISYGQTQQSIPKETVKQLAAKLAQQEIIIQDIRAERNNLIIQVATLTNQLNVFTAGVKKTERLLQEAINNGGKVDFKELILTGWNIALPDSTATKPNKNNP